MKLIKTTKFFGQIVERCQGISSKHGEQCGLAAQSGKNTCRFHAPKRKTKRISPIAPPPLPIDPEAAKRAKCWQQIVKQARENVDKFFNQSGRLSA